MRVYLNKLTQQLKQPLPQVVMLFGDEPYQLQQALDQIRQAAKQQGCEERIRFSHDNQFKWQQLFDEAQELSLFASKKLIELEMPSVKPGRDGGKALVEWSELVDNEHILLLWGGKVAREQTNSKWFKTLDKQGWYIPVYDIDSQQLPNWLQQQFQQNNLQVTPDAIGLMCRLFEGNLLSAAQEVTRLGLLHPNQLIDVQQIRDAVSDQSRFNVFQLVDDLLAGKLSKATHVLERLKGEEVEPVIISWALQKEVDSLIAIHKQQQQGQALAQIFKGLRIWDKKQGMYKATLQRLDLAKLKQIHDALALFDLEYKSSGLAHPYTLLAHCCALFSGQAQLLAFNQMLTQTALELRADD